MTKRITHRVTTIALASMPVLVVLATAAGWKVP
jgi:hypothetical protein